MHKRNVIFGILLGVMWLFFILVQFNIFPIHGKDIWFILLLLTWVIVELLLLNNRSKLILNNESKSNYFPALTGLRAIAAGMVFFHHYNIPNSGEIIGKLFLQISREFYTGVTVFFVLSGFLIYYRYNKYANTSKYFIINYIVNRAARIYPMYLIIVIITSIGLLFTKESTFPIVIRDFFLQITFIRGFSDTFKFIGVGQGWTLTVEEVFYLSFPLLLINIRKEGFFKTLLWVYIIGLLLLCVGVNTNFAGFFSNYKFVALYTFFGRAAEFFIGMFVAELFIKKKDTLENNNHFPTTTFIGFLGIVLCLWGLSALVTPAYDYGASNPLGIIVNNFLLPIFVGYLLYGLVVEQSIIVKFLGSKGMVLLGKSSYCFYLLHVGLYTLLTKYFSVNYWVVFVLTIICSIIMFLMIENPLNNYIKRYFHSKGY